ncbi:hypothetical protein MIR68_002594 [Amoeboaphelidium protococcarum]|nr:hypothetical protein MIR68_009703 [Amoeboaphelidium protococcarum]KAI3636117.1 hypothetical protein MIR68_005998 [Amoeboaphelidium protococcarum]KAI3638395.1 hypothetical protein MIR68_003570 [Amoeboaphelidium protococcarum]KAI3639064.1 hypothetical protein MIR68_002594 [Amoeboaphelidium protococcarum]
MNNKSASFVNIYLSSDILDSIITYDPLGDGNCLSRAISYSMYGTEKKWKKVKNLSLKEVKDNKSVYCDMRYEHSQGEYLELVRSLETDGVYLAQFHIAAIANALGVIIALHDQIVKVEDKIISNSGGCTFIPKRYVQDSKGLKLQDLKTLHIAWSTPSNANHFISLSNISVLPSNAILQGHKSSRRALLPGWKDFWDAQSKYTDFKDELPNADSYAAMKDAGLSDAELKVSLQAFQNYYQKREEKLKQKESPLLAMPEQTNPSQSSAVKRPVSADEEMSAASDQKSVMSSMTSQVDQNNSQNDKAESNAVEQKDACRSSSQHKTNHVVAPKTPAKVVYTYQESIFQSSVIKSNRFSVLSQDDDAQSEETGMNGRPSTVQKQSFGESKLNPTPFFHSHVSQSFEIVVRFDASKNEVSFANVVSNSNPFVKQLEVAESKKSTTANCRPEESMIESTKADSVRTGEQEDDEDFMNKSFDSMEQAMEYTQRWQNSLG